MGIRSSTSGLDVKEGAEPNYAVYLFAWRGISEEHVPYICHERFKMFANTTESILGLLLSGRAVGQREGDANAMQHVDTAY